MVTEVMIKYKVRCDFCDREYEEELPSGSVPPMGFIHFKYDDIEYESEAGHMCDVCLNLLETMCRTRDQKNKKSGTSPSAKTCKNCKHCSDKEGRGRGVQYKCSLSNAWYLVGHHDICDAWEKQDG